MVRIRTDKTIKKKAKDTNKKKKLINYGRMLEEFQDRDNIELIQLLEKDQDFYSKYFP